MGKRNSTRKNLATKLDSDDTDSVSSASSVRSDLVLGGYGEEVEKDSLLDQTLELLFEKRGSTREKALGSIIEAFSTEMQHEFVEKSSHVGSLDDSTFQCLCDFVLGERYFCFPKPTILRMTPVLLMAFFWFATLLHQCVNSIKRDSGREASLASHAIGLLALTMGSSKNTREILEESLPAISQSLRSKSESAKIASLLECLSIITFIGGEDPEETEKSLQTMWQVVHPKLGTNVVTIKPSPMVIGAMVSSWSFLLTAADSLSLTLKYWQESIAYLSTLLDKDGRSVRIAAGEALAVIFEIGNFEKYSAEGNGFDGGTDKDNREGFVHLKGLRCKVINQVKDLASEAGGKGAAKKDLNNQRNLFRDLLEFLEDGYAPETSTKIGGESLNTSSWSELIRLNFLKHFLRGGFVKHMQDNEFLHDVFGFVPKKKTALGNDGYSLGKYNEKRLNKSPNSALAKSRTLYMNKQRMMSQEQMTSHFAVGGRRMSLL